MKNTMTREGTELAFIIVGASECGKSALAGRLLFETGALAKDKIIEIKKISKELGRETELAFILEQLKEKQDESITGVISFRFSGKKNEYRIIDYLWNLKLIKLILEGEENLQTAIVIIDMRNGVDEQVKRYVSLLKILGLENIIVIGNKMDMIDYSQTKFQEIEHDLIQVFSHFSLPPPVLIPVSTKLGINITNKAPELVWYKGPSLLKTLDALPVKINENNKPFMFPVQDVYSIDGKSVIVGRIAAGLIKTGDTISVYPAKTEVRILEILDVNKKNVRKAIAGENIGLIVDTGVSTQRGDVFVHTSTDVNPVSRVSLFILWLSENPLEIGTRLTFCCATREVSCHVEEIQCKMNTSTLEVLKDDADTLDVNDAGIVTFSTENPIVIEKASFIEDFGRILLKKEGSVLGIGRI